MDYSQKKMDELQILIVILSIVAVLMNSTTLVAIQHIRRRLSANQTMMFSLCCADLLTAVAILARMLNPQFFDMLWVPDNHVATATCVFKVIQVSHFCNHIVVLVC